MTEERKVTIIKEIKYWKENKILPTKYCDFLLALYSQGQDSGENSYSRWSFKDTILLLSNLFLFSLTFFVIYFTQLSWRLQIPILFLFTATAFGYYWILMKRNKVIGQFSLFLLLLIVFLISVNLIAKINFFSYLVHIVVIINCVGWMLIGSYKKIKLLTISGVIGVVIVMILVLI